MDLKLTLDFLADLALHNQKEWMDDNKKRYLQAKEQVIELVASVVDQASAFDPSLVGVDARKTLFRINRDIRFAKNKDPYKTNFGASIVQGGRKSGNPGYYLHLMPGNSFVGGGIYQPSADTLQKVRQEIDYNGEQLKRIIEDHAFSSTYSSPFLEDALKTAPMGYPKDHENIELLRLKHYVYMRKISDEVVVESSFPDLIVRSYEVLYPYNQFLMQAIQ